MAINSSTSLAGWGNQTGSSNQPLSSSMGNTLPSQTDAASHLSISNSAHASISGLNTPLGPQLLALTEPDDLNQLGLLALGTARVKQWAEQGLELSEQTLKAAAVTFQQGLKQSIDQNSDRVAGSKLAINAHEIVLHHQPAPDWFVDQYRETVDVMDDHPLKQAFSRGEHFFITEPAAKISAALAGYAAVD